MLKQSVFLFLVWKIVIVLFALIAIHLLPLYSEFIPKPYFREGYPYLVWIWGNFDGYHYLSIAQNGYGQLQYPFFPLYPLAIRITSLLLRLRPLMAGLIISHVAFFISLLVFHRIFKLDKITPRVFMFLPLILYPTSFYYGAVYNDGLYLLFSSLTILYARRRKWMIASIWGALAGVTRLNGLALFFYVVAEYLTIDYRIHEMWHMQTIWLSLKKAARAMRKTILPLSSFFLIPLSFLSYLLYVQLRYGSWHLIFSAMKVWNQDKITFPLQVFWRYLKIITLYPRFDITYFVAFLEISLVVFYCYMLLYGYKKIRISYWIFVFVSFLIPSLTGTFAGMPRYALHLYPFFLLVSLWLLNNNVILRVLYFVVSIGLLLFCITLFTRGYFVS